MKTRAELQKEIDQLNHRIEIYETGIKEKDAKIKELERNNAYLSTEGSAQIEQLKQTAIAEKDQAINQSNLFYSMFKGLKIFFDAKMDTKNPSEVALRMILDTLDSKVEEEE